VQRTEVQQKQIFFSFYFLQHEKCGIISRERYKNGKTESEKHGNE